FRASAAQSRAVARPSPRPLFSRASVPPLRSPMPLQFRTTPAWSSPARPARPPFAARAYLASPVTCSPTAHPCTPAYTRVLATRRRASPPDAHLSPVRPSVTPDHPSASTTTSVSFPPSSRHSLSPRMRKFST
ncbi:Unknown protein, partial [Striga hermonthica]